MLYKVDIITKNVVEFRDISARVREIIKSSGVRDGTCHLFVPHTTSGITINEHADPAVVEDIEARLEEVAPQKGNYRHVEGNAAAHVKASLMGSAQELFIENGQIVLGTWQGIFFCEFDGPRNRQLLVKVVPDNS